MLLGGIDIGTTGSKLTVYTSDGEYKYNVYKEYDVSRVNGEHEIDAQMIFDAVCFLLKEAEAQIGSIDAIGVTSFGETFVFVDKDGGVLLPSMLYTDPRGEDELNFLIEKIGTEKIEQVCGLKPHQMYSLPKIMWLKNNRPEIYEKSDKILLIEDYIVYKLTGVAQIDYSLATRTMAFDIRNKCWYKEMFDIAGVDSEKLAKPVPSGTVAGKIKADLKEKLGLSGDTVIVNACHDQVAAAVGSGVFHVGEAVDGTGTVECVTPMFDKIPEDKHLYDGGYAVVPYVFDGTYVCYAVTFTGGATLKWYRDNFAKFERAEAEKNGGNVYAVLDNNAPGKPTDLLILPHFAGSGNPYMDRGSKAAILGLTLETTNYDIYKALMEGVSLEIRQNIEYLASCGIKLHKIYATGGGAASKVWLQIKADIFGCPITTLTAGEVGACGTCMMVAVAMGVYKDITAAKEHFVSEKATYEPQKANAEIYDRKFEAYKEIYGSIRHIADKI